VKIWISTMMTTSHKFNKKFQTKKDKVKRVWHRTLTISVCHQSLNKIKFHLKKYLKTKMSPTSSSDLHCICWSFNFSLLNL
jgi:hypothetical protein